MRSLTDSAIAGPNKPDAHAASAPCRPPPRITVIPFDEIDLPSRSDITESDAPRVARSMNPTSARVRDRFSPRLLALWPHHSVPSERVILATGLTHLRSPGLDLMLR